MMVREKEREQERDGESERAGSGGWVPVIRNHRIHSGGGSEVKATFTLFIDNIPEKRDQVWLSRTFNKFGVVNDAFIPRKKSKRTGGKFGFVRYGCHVSAAMAVAKMNGVWVDDKRLFVKEACFDQRREILKPKIPRFTEGRALVTNQRFKLNNNEIGEEGRPLQNAEKVKEKIEFLQLEGGKEPVVQRGEVEDDDMESCFPNPTNERREVGDGVRTSRAAKMTDGQRLEMDQNEVQSSKQGDVDVHLMHSSEGAKDVEGGFEFFVGDSADLGAQNGLEVRAQCGLPLSPPLGLSKSSFVEDSFGPVQILGIASLYLLISIPSLEIVVLQIAGLVVRQTKDFIGKSSSLLSSFVGAVRWNLGFVSWNGDFDGDMYWVSRNPELLDSFKVRRPWRRIYSTPSVPSKKPNELSMCLVNGCNCYSLFVVDSNIGQFVQGHGRGCALDSFPNLFLTKQVVIPDELKVEKFPHYMGRTNNYHSTSVLGLIYDTVEKPSQSEDLPAKGEKARPLPRELVDGAVTAITSVAVIPNCSILAAVGQKMASTPGVNAALFNALAKANINVRAIAQGCSEYNITLVVKREDCVRALRAVHSRFYLPRTTIAMGIIGP
ncbi:hypothetical protein RHGRI_033540 [Rhododendron griersonianum]|uniref:aspartate kinase n=1 Tax=Rhododendron griersonianum TaxID=479676 RepID=A0AAV6HX63_9ERIC|nr:hypothetical protein RHGRI_033540 [Rhododendron griersonianum]